MAGITLDHVTKRFDDGTVAVDDVSLDIADGEFLVLVGPSGCGKSTLLRMIAGLEEVTEGAIAIGGEDVTWLPPKDRDIAMVFQTYALYPHMPVEQNLGFSLRLRRAPKDEVKARVGQVARLLGLDGLLDRKPAALSGGQRQRVAMGRAMVREPRTFLMDEPLSNLDAKLRSQMRTELAQQRDHLRTTSVYVTHDQTEAMTLGHRVAVLSAGRLQQLDTPRALFDHPTNLFVASFMGSPSMNIVGASVIDGDLRFGGHALPIPQRYAELVAPGAKVVAGIRPTWFEDAALSGDRSLPQIDVDVSAVEHLGSEAHVVFSVDEPPVVPRTVAADPDSDAVVLPTAVDFEEPARVASRFVASVGPGTTARAGQRLRLAVDVSAIHLFDPETEQTLDVAPFPRSPDAQLAG